MPQLTLSEERVNILIDALGTYMPYSLLVGTEQAAKGLRSYLRLELYKAKKAKEPGETFWVSGTVCPSKMPACSLGRRIR